MHTDIITNDLEDVVKVIKENNVVAFPTGTVYGLAVNALSSTALTNLRIIKNRPEEKTFTVFLKESLINDYFVLTDEEKLFLQKANSLPLTVLLKAGPKLNHLAQDSLVGLRIIDHSLMRSLADAFPYPLTATSANISGQEACLTPQCIREKLPAVKCIWGDQELQAAPASTILRFNNGDIEIIRPGSLSKEYLTKLV